MAYSHYDRLSSLDATFLQIESPSVHMHVGAVAMFDGAEELDMPRARALCEASLARTPRLRQRLEPIPGLYTGSGWTMRASRSSTTCATRACRNRATSGS